MKKKKKTLFQENLVFELEKDDINVIRVIAAIS
jgi:hypothetical protein